MLPEAYDAFVKHGIFTPGNYFYNGIGHVCVQYDKVLAKGYRGILAEATAALEKLDVSDGDYVQRSNFLNGKRISQSLTMSFTRSAFNRANS